MMERHPHALLTEAQAHDKCASIVRLHQIAMSDSLNAALMTTEIAVCHNRIERIRLEWSIWALSSRICDHVTILGTTLCSSDVIPVPDMEQMR